jgi:hypothetical protein
MFISFIDDCRDLLAHPQSNIRANTKSNGGRRILRLPPLKFYYMLKI